MVLCASLFSHLESAERLGFIWPFSFLPGGDLTPYLQDLKWSWNYVVGPKCGTNLNWQNLFPSANINISNPSTSTSSLLCQGSEIEIKYILTGQNLELTHIGIDTT